MPSFMIMRLQISEIKRKRKKSRPRASAAQCGRKSKFQSAHVIPRHSEVLHAKFHHRATSNLRDYAETKKSGRLRLRRNAAENQNPT